MRDVAVGGAVAVKRHGQYGVLALGIMAVMWMVWRAMVAVPEVDSVGTVPASGAETPTAGGSSHAPLPIRTHAAAASFVLSGVVQTHEGAPVDNVQVVFRSHARLEYAGDWDAEHRVRTDPAGRFLMRVSEPGYLSVAEGAAPSFIEIDASRGDIVFQRGESCALDVSVVDAQDQPVSGFLFGFFYRDPGLPVGAVGLPSGPFVTDEGGRYRLQHAPCGALQLQSAAEGQDPMESARVDTWVDQSITLRVLASLSVDGVLLDADGDPVSEAGISARWSSGVTRVRVGADGRFQMKLPPEEKIWFHAATASLGTLHLSRLSPALGEGPWAVALKMLAVRPVTARCPDDGIECVAREAPVCVWEGPDPEARRRQDCWMADDGRSYGCLCGPAASQLLCSGHFEDMVVGADVTEVTLSRDRSSLAGLELQSVRGSAILLGNGAACLLPCGRPHHRSHLGTRAV